MSFIVFNGIPSTDVNARIVQPPERKSPEKPYSALNHIGSNTSIILDSGSYQNVEVTYNMSMDVSKENVDFNNMASAIFTWLHPSEPGSNGYYKLIDAYDPTHFRWAKLKGDITISNILNQAGVFDITFDCMPQRFLVSGESPISVSSSSVSIYNLTSQIAFPVITLDGMPTSGYISVTNRSGVNANSTYGCRIKCTSYLGPTKITCAEERSYNTADNVNNSALLSLERYIDYGGLYDWKKRYDFPVLYPGENIIRQSDVSNLKIIPNWYEL